MDLRHHKPCGYILGPGNNTFIAHCNHYNCFLQKVLRSNKGLGMDDTMVETASMLFYLEFTNRFQDEGWTAEEKADYIERFLKARGYGNPRVAPALDGDDLRATASHFSSGYRAKYGVQDEPQDLFLTGAIQGGLMAALQHDVAVNQTACMAMGDEKNVWSVTLHSDSTEQVEDHRATAKQIRDGRRQIQLKTPPEHLRSASLTTSVRNMSLIGDEEEGLIPAFNVYLTFIPSLYYVICSMVMIRRMSERGLSADLGRRLLKEAGQVCGFYTLGNIMLSSEYTLLRQANFGSAPTRRESMEALFGVVNALGWGYWQLERLEGESLAFSSFNGYESFNILEYFGGTDTPECMLLRGGGEAIMNFLCDGDILAYNGEINRAYVNEVFESSDGFVATETSCFAMDDARCEIKVERPEAKSKGETSVPAGQRTFFAPNT